ncbi:hypothetical protein H310_04365 [Aphanomyces invadans]|uniref:Uncharacterized protein n=1 Tax=Aphanomyces invadans TaxID=157072 RepID=A0A024UDL1_9STRA|nr:hypothetical protein H310_04365 [Aphanomyces invadans]ETW03957.1 hypothetical protein H310_04365 [Aphanomyces invadans]|eukprot:XP_008866913.1 hypothetical protein H310_04365 [Aphanomyces invadans]
MPPADDHLRGLLELVAPDSLSVNGNELDHASQAERDAASHAVTLTKPGDVILVTSGGFIYSTGRYLTQQPWDHALLVVDATKALHVGFPRVCYVSLERVLLPKRQPAIYRVPTIHDSPSAQSLIQKYAELMQDTPYDIARAITLGRQLTLEHLFNLKSTARAAPPRKAWVCTDAILSLLAACSPTFHSQLKAQAPRLDLSRLGIASLKDFLTLHHHSVLTRVPLPPYNFNVQPTPAFDTAYVLKHLVDFPNPVIVWEKFHGLVERFASDAAFQHPRVLQKQMQALVYAMMFLLLLKKHAVVLSIVYRALQLYLVKQVALALLPPSTTSKL